MNVFRYFTGKKTRLSLPAERLSYLYTQWVAYDAICKVGLYVELEVCRRTEISCVSRGNKGFGNLP